jgi:HD superfamily phosphohydrolase YqeK
MDRPDSLLSRAFSVGLFVLALGLIAVVLVLGPTPSWGAVIVLAALLLLSDSTEIVLESGSTLKPATILMTAAIVVFATEGALAGPLLVALLAQVCFPHWWQNRKWAKLAFNTGMYVAMVAVAWACVALLPSAYLSSPGGLIVVGLIAGAALLATNELILAIVEFLAERRIPADLFREGLPYIAFEFPWAVVGAFLGTLYISVGVAIVPLIVTPILIARQAFVSYLTLKDTQQAATDTLIRALESKDAYTAGHVERVATYAEYIGQELQFTPGRLERLRLAALVHDIGKLIVPNELLNKPGRLTEDEFAIVKRHEQVSMELLREIDFLAPVAPSASSVHTSYEPDDPRHPIEPYIVHVADAYDAMTSTRAYRKALSQGVAFAELRDKAGTQFHPVVVEALISAIRKRGEVHGRGHEDEQHLWAVPPPEAGTGSAGLGDLAGGEPSR